MGKPLYAYRCEICDDDRPMWRLDRRGDAAVSWACTRHLSEVCDRMQRGYEVTELVVRRATSFSFDEAAVTECGDCHRKGWQPAEVGVECCMPQPDGHICQGRFVLL
jgi:hypothetical protein